jgi:TolA-binding protein
MDQVETESGGRIKPACRMVARWARGHLGAWIVAATALCAALVTLITVMITLPGQSGTNIGILFFVLAALLCLTVIFPVAGHVVESKKQGAERELEHQERVSRRYLAWRERVDRLLIVGSSDGLPRLSELTDDQLGVTPTRYSMEGSAPYIRRRGADEKIRDLLRAPGPPYPFVLVWGATKAGKSRTLAEALRASFEHDPAVVLPRDGQALAELARLGMSEMAGQHPAIVVVDDLDPSGLDALTGEVLSLIGGWAVIAATMTASRRAAVLATGGDAGAVARSALATVSGDYELASEPPVGIERAEAERWYPEEHFDGSIAETLVGGRELIARYKAGYDSDPAGCAVVRAAIDARRAGVYRPVTGSELRRLFPFYLSDIRTGLAPTDDQFDLGIEWATRPIASQVALLRPSKQFRGTPSWTVLDHVVAADEGQGGLARPIPDEVWDKLIEMLPPQDLISVGRTAYKARKHVAAKNALRRAINSRDDIVAPFAACHLGQLLDKLDDKDGARAAFQLAIDSGHPDFAPLAAIQLGNLLSSQGDAEGARAAFQLAIDSRHNDLSPRATTDLGYLLRDEGDAEGARAAFQLAIESGHADAAPKAAVGLGFTLYDLGDADGARTAFQLAIGSGHAEYAPEALFNLGALLYACGDMDAARTAYVAAIDSGHFEEAPKAAFNLAALLREQGDRAGARAAYQTAIDSGYSDIAPKAALNLALLLSGQDDAPGAQAAYQVAVGSGHPAVAPRAAFNLALLLREQGDAAGAQAAYRVAVDSGHPEEAPLAAFSLGVMLAERGDVDGARTAYQMAVDSGHSDAAVCAAVKLLDLQLQQPDSGKSRPRCQASDSGQADEAPTAAFSLGLTLAGRGDVDGACAAYQIAIDSGHPDKAPGAAVNLGALLHARGDFDGARAAYQTAINSGQANAAPAAAANLGLMLTGRGDLEGARIAYQIAIDSRHPEVSAAAKHLLDEIDRLLQSREVK